MKKNQEIKTKNIYKAILICLGVITLSLLFLGHIQKIEQYRLTENLDVGIMCLDKGYNSYQVIESMHGYIFENDYPVYTCNIILNYEDVKNIEYHHKKRYTQNE